jgi:ectoine hydroxylase-related dioxygenase (phytanoyl-CoA dioxygenase family)
VSIASELRVVVEPGDLLVFSGAHLHASVPNATGVARFSVEVCAADAEDEASGRGAPNLEAEAPRVALDWFRKVMDGMLLPVAMRNRD